MGQLWHRLVVFIGKVNAMKPHDKAAAGADFDRASSQLGWVVISPSSLRLRDGWRLAGPRPASFSIQTVHAPMPRLPGCVGYTDAGLNALIDTNTIEI